MPMHVAQGRGVQAPAASPRLRHCYNLTINQINTAKCKGVLKSIIITIVHTISHRIDRTIAHVVTESIVN